MFDNKILEKYGCDIEKYNFLYDRKELGNNIILLCLGGSHSYGTNVSNSDFDLRGIACNNRSSILQMNDFGTYNDNLTDTTIYSVEKFLNLATGCNPGIIEMLGCKKDDYLFLSSLGKLILNNKECFISQRCTKTFEGYAKGQMKLIEKQILQGAKSSKISKSIMHYIRIRTMYAEILEEKSINTNRKDKDFLLNIRNGLFLTNNSLNKDFFEFDKTLTQRIEFAKKNTNLPEAPDYKKINEIHEEINLHIINSI